MWTWFAGKVINWAWFQCVGGVQIGLTGYFLAATPLKMDQPHHRAAQTMVLRAQYIVKGQHSKQSGHLHRYEAREVRLGAVLPYEVVKIFILRV